MLSGAGGGAAGEVLDGPLADPASLWQVVLELRQVAALSAAAGQTLPEPRAWSGLAADACRSAHAECVSRLDTTAEVAGTVAAVLNRLALAVERARDEVARCRRELADVEAEQAGRAALVAAGLPDPGWTDLGERLRAVRSRHAAAMADYSRAMTAAAQALAALYEQVPAAQRGMTTGDRAWQAWRGFGRTFAVEAVQGVWALTGELLVDPRRWWSSLEGLPAAQWQQMRHPFRTYAQLLSLDSFAHDGGDWTESAGRVAGAAAGMALGFGRAGREARLLALGERQTLAEMRQGVRLRRHEGPGHTLANHVLLDDDGLDLRIDEELDMMPVARRSRVIIDRSRFLEEDLADQLATQALLANDDAVRRWLASNDRRLVIEQGGMSAMHGRLRRRYPDGSRQFIEPQRVRLVLSRDELGPYIKTTYLKADR